MGRSFVALAAAASCVFGSNMARAVNVQGVDVQVVVTQAADSGQVLASWDQGLNPVPIAFVTDYYTTVPIWNATGLGSDTSVTWYSVTNSHLGGFTNYSEMFNVVSGQAYTGLESLPVFQVGSYFGINLDPNLTYSAVDFTISLLADASLQSGPINLGQGVASVPEPASWATLLIGLGMIGFVTRRRDVRLARV